MLKDIEILEDHTAQTPSDAGFIKVRRYTLRAVLEDGTHGAPFRYDVADRAALDAVCMVLWADNPRATEDPLVCLRRGLRPPVALRRTRSLVVPDRVSTTSLWELPAGLIEADEEGHDPVRFTAAREAEEEVGLRLSPADFRTLGVPVFLTPGLCAEKLHYVSAKADPSSAQQATTTETVEAHAQVLWLPLSQALAQCADATIEDCKTELGLLRFHRTLR